MKDCVYRGTCAFWMCGEGYGCADQAQDRDQGQKSEGLIWVQ